MISLLIVDDEATIRKGLTTVIDWESFGIEIVGEAVNGKEGLRLALDLEPDIIIADIRMPVMDGVRMADEIRSRLPDAKIIILSGYSDFEASRKALKAGVVDYLLKPVKVAELTDLISTLKGRIEEDRRSASEKRTAERLLSDTLPYLRMQRLRDFAQGAVGIDEFRIQAERYFGLVLSGPRFQVLAMEVDDHAAAAAFAVARERFEAALEAAAAARLGGGTRFSAACGGGTAALLLTTDAEMERVAAFCTDVQAGISEGLGFSVSVGMGDQVSRIDEIPFSWGRAWAALEAKIYRGTNRLILPEEGLPAGGPPLILREGDEDELTEYLRLLRGDLADRKLSEIFRGYFDREVYSRKTADRFTGYLAGIAFRELLRNRMEPAEVFAEGAGIYEEIDGLETIQDRERWVRGAFSRIIEGLVRHRSGRPGNLAERGMEFARARFAENIQVADVAAAVSVTPNYFSRLFKQETGENFSEWFNKYRVKKAKERLVAEPEAKALQIALEGGFRDYKYFIFIFKKYANCTPSEYRQRMGPCGQGGA